MGEFSEKQNMDSDGETQKQKERMETKIYVARDVNGEPNREELSLIREVAEELDGYPGFVGIVPFGSVVSGYSIDNQDNSYDKGSDIDFYLLFDRKINNDKEMGDFRKRIKGAYWERMMKLGKDVHFEFIPIQSIDKFKIDMGDEDIIHQIACLSGLAIGKSMNQYREVVAKELQQLSKEEQEKIVELIVEDLSERNYKSLEKRKKRGWQLANFQHKDILEKRKEMWKKRVKKIWEIGE